MISLLSLPMLRQKKVERKKQTTIEADEKWNLATAGNRGVAQLHSSLMIADRKRYMCVHIHD